jgi:MraZ protein
VFQGTSNLTIDAKGRLSMPTRHRDALLAQCEGRLTLTLHPDGCLLVYPRPVWLTRREALGQLNATARDLLRMLIGSASDVDSTAPAASSSRPNCARRRDCSATSS